MKIKTMNFISKSNEKLTTIFILDNNDNEVERYSFYNEPREIKIYPELEKSIDNISYLLHMVYNSGLKQEKIDFINENLNVD